MGGATDLVRPGCYPDPTGIHPQRFWDGESWTAGVVDRVGAVCVHRIVEVYAPPSVAIAGPATAERAPPPLMQLEVAPLPLSPARLPVPVVVETLATPLPVQIATPVASPSSSGVRTLQVVRRTKPRGTQFYLSALAALVFLVTCIVAVFAGNTGMDLLWRVLAVLAGVALAAVLWLVTRPRGMDVYPSGLVILVNGQPVTLPWTTIERIDDYADPEHGLGINVVRDDNRTMRVQGDFESPQQVHAVADGLRQELERARQTTIDSHRAD